LVGLLQPLVPLFDHQNFTRTIEITVQWSEVPRSLDNKHKTFTLAFRSMYKEEHINLPAESWFRLGCCSLWLRYLSGFS
jgi:hypothetical protein